MFHDQTGYSRQRLCTFNARVLTLISADYNLLESVYIKASTLSLKR
jgi:hypothetical protein